MASTPAHKRPLGRPAALDTTKREVVIALVAAGRSRTEAARYVGVAPQTVLNTEARDTDFAQRLEQAAAGYHLEHLGAIRSASSRSWHASAWVLERIDPAQFSDPRSRTARRAAVRKAFDRFRKTLEQEVEDPELCGRLTACITRIVRRVA